MKFKLNKLYTKIKKVLLMATTALLGFSLIWVMIYKFVNPPFTSLMLIRYLTDSKENRRVLKKWIDIEDISTNLVLATLASEDQRFMEHNGFDFNEINNSILEFQERGRLRGASTISQQTAKNVFLFPTKNWLRKGLESYFTVLIEIIWNKKRIMEVYLNVAEYGHGIYGVEAASNIYFNKSAKSLTESESAYLASLLPNPVIYSKNYSDNQKRRQIWILKQMKNLGGPGYVSKLYKQ